MAKDSGVFQELEGTWDSFDGSFSILHIDGEEVRGHLVCTVLSCPAGDVASKMLPVERDKGITQE